MVPLPTICQLPINCLSQGSMQSLVYSYEPGAYMQHLVTLISDKLWLESDTPRTILDVGEGIGNFAQALIDHNPSHGGGWDNGPDADSFLLPCLFQGGGP